MEAWLLFVSIFYKVLIRGFSVSCGRGRVVCIFDNWSSFKNYSLISLFKQ